jgi:hypothetical protein
MWDRIYHCRRIDDDDCFCRALYSDFCRQIFRPHPPCLPVRVLGSARPTDVHLCPQVFGKMFKSAETAPASA